MYPKDSRHLKLPRFYGDGNSNERENPDGSEKEAHIYKEEFRHQAVEMVVHRGKTRLKWR
jgi:hypothetical protein